MDHSYQYIASLTREPFLFYEMRSTAKLMVSGLSDEAVVKKLWIKICFNIQQRSLLHAWQKLVLNGFKQWKMILLFCDCISANRCCKTDLSLRIDETESIGI